MTRWPLAALLLCACALTPPASRSLQAERDALHGARSAAQLRDLGWIELALGNGAAGTDALRRAATPPGEPVGPGDWAKAVELIKGGKDIDYTGATGSMDFDDKGDVAGVIGHFVVEGTGYKEVGLVTP